MWNSMMMVIVVAIALGTDAFSVALGLGVAGASPTFRKRFVALVGIMHVFMPLVGLYLGLTVGKFLGRMASVLGAVILFLIGLEMLKKGFQKESPMTWRKAKYKPMEKRSDGDLANWASLLVLGVSVSVDALTVGFSLGAAKVPILYTVLITGLVAALMTSLGWVGAKFFSEVMGKRAQTLGGLMLAAIAVKMLM